MRARGGEVAITGVNASGWGGSDAHAILEEPPESDQGPSVLHAWDTEVCILQAASRQGLIDAGQQLMQVLSTTPDLVLTDLACTLACPLRDSAPYRLAMVASSPHDLQKKLLYGLQRLADSGCTQIKDRSGIFFFEAPLSREGRLAFLFPGEGSQYTNMLADLCLHFPEVRAWFDLLDRVFIKHQSNCLPSQVLFPPPGGKAERDSALAGQLWHMDLAMAAVCVANQALYTLLSHLGIRPQAVVGHSTGEYSALLAAGAIEVDRAQDGLQYLLDWQSLMARALTTGTIPDGVLLAVGPAERDLIASLVERAGDALYVAMDNCAHQVVLFVLKEAAVQIMEQLRSCGAVYTVLPFNRPYHTPLWAPACTDLYAFMQRLKLVPPQVEVYSCATAQPYPPTLEALRRLPIEQLTRPVRFRETIEAMYAAGVRLFVEVGARGNLTAFTADILRTRPHVAVAANVMRRSGVTQLHHLVALLAAHQVPMHLDYLFARRAPRRLSLAGAEASVEQLRESAESIRLPQQDGLRSATMQAYLHTMERFLSVQQEVMTAFMAREGNGEAKERQVL